MTDTSGSKLYITVAFLSGAILALTIKDVIHHRLKAAKDKEDATTPKAERQPPPIVDGIEGTIGNTHLMRIRSLSEATGCEILAKVEFLNGAGNSPKDRVALNIIETAEQDGLLHPHSGDAIYEGTSGSTGISLATLARARGYLAHICMPSDQAIEKSDLLSKLGAIVDRVSPAPIVEKRHFVNRARSLAQSHSLSPAQSSARSSPALEHGPGDPDLETAIEEAKQGKGFFSDQFENEANWKAHYRGTGSEIFTQCKGKLDAFVAGAGTGGTISGVALYLKPRVPQISIVLADPQGSGLYNRVRYGVMFDIKEREGTRRRKQVDTIVEGIGVNRVIRNFEAGRELIDDAIRVTDSQALAMARWLVEKDGIFVGSSSAVNCFAAVKTAFKIGPGHRIVTMLCDSGARHMSRFWKKAGDIGGVTDTRIEDVLNVKDEDFN